MTKRNIENMIRPYIKDIVGYDPVKHPDSIKQNNSSITKIIKLNGNENPYGTSPKISSSLNNYPIHIYPDPNQNKIRQKLAEHVGADILPSQIIAGAGSDEIIELLLKLFINPQDEIIIPEPTFGMYRFFSAISQAKTINIPRDERFDVDINTTISNINDKTKMIFLCSPNNPTGNLISITDTQKILETGIITVIDEAYYEFAGSGSSVIKLTTQYDNLIILRTFSKWAGLAALRIGYGIMSQILVNYLLSIKTPYNINIVAENAMLLALEDKDFLMDRIQNIIDERDNFIAELKHISFIKPYPSHANFVLCEFESSTVANKLNLYLQQNGIFIRTYPNQKRLENFLRISIGTSDQMKFLLAKIKEFKHIK